MSKSHFSPSRWLSTCRNKLGLSPWFALSKVSFLSVFFLEFISTFGVFILIFFLMKKRVLSSLGYVLWGALFLAWILFLFFDAKRGDSEEPQIAISENLASQGRSTLTFSWQASSPQEKNQTILMSSDFLSGGGSLSADRLQALWDLKEKIQLLEKLFIQQASPEIGNLLFTSYLLDNQFETAKKTYFSLSSQLKNQLDSDLAFKIWINAFSQTSDTEYHNLKVLLEQYHQQGIFSDLEKTYYATVFALIEKRYSDAQVGLKMLAGTKYQDFAMAIDSAFAQYSTLKDVPSYYQDGLVAYQLMRQGFLAGAKKMALPIINQHSDYILPYQILAKIDFMMGKWESATSYFSQLLELDYQEKNLYLYHLGVCYYHLQKYSDAVLYLAQISDPKILLDSDRYLVLSYLALGEQERVFAGWQRLLGYSSIKKSDFYSFFEEVFWKPYRLGSPSPYLKKNPKLVNAYLLTCPKKLKGEDAVICEYGQLGLAVQQGNTLELASQVARFARKTPKSEFFQLLGELSLEKWEKKEATAAFMRALSLTNESAERTYLKRLILRANDMESE